MGKHSQHAGRETATRDTATAAEGIFCGAIDAIQAQVKDTNAIQGGRPVLLETLFPEPPSSIRADIPVLPFAEEFSKWLTLVQVSRTDAILKERLTSPLGLLDLGVTIFAAFYDNSQYMRRLLDRIAFDAAGEYENHGLDAFVDLVGNRFYVMTREGLTKTDASEAELKDMYARHVDWHQKWKSRFPLGPRLNSNYHLLSRRKESSQVKQVAVVLGCLPLVDEYDVAIAKCGQQLLPVLPNHAASGDEPPSAMKRAVMDILSKGEYVLSPEEYWSRYKDFLAGCGELPPTDSVAPPTPGQYREILAARQALRDTRLRLIAAYTGLHRRNATEQDVLAAPHPLFFRLAEELVRQTGCGVVSLVSPPEFLSDQSAERMRKQLHSYFNSIFVVEEREINKNDTELDGLPQGTVTDLSIITMGKAGGRNAIEGGKPGAEVWYLDNLNVNRPNLSTLLSAPAISDSHPPFKSVFPSARNGYSFRPPAMSAEYQSWPSTAGIYSARINGPMGKRGNLLIDVDRTRLADRMRAYFDAGLSWEEYAKLGFEAKKRKILSNSTKFREEARRKERYSAEKIKPYLVKPFDVRWCYYTPVRPIWDEPRPELAELQSGGNHFLVVRANNVIDEEGIPIFFTDLLGDSDLLRGHAYYIPIWHKDWNGRRAVNLSEAIREYVEKLGVLRDSTLEDAALMVHHHVLAIGFSPLYLHENRSALAQGWPRIPFPGFDTEKPETAAEAREAFRISARLGGQVAQLLAVDSEERDASTPTTDDNPLRHFGVLTENSVSQRNNTNKLFAVNQEWGKVFRSEAVLPSHGKLLSRNYSVDERRTVEAVARSMRVHAGAAYSLLGDSTRDIYLNDRVRLRNIPAKAWDFTVGGYPVLKKWLSYRETEILGRPLTFDEVDGFCAVIRRIVALRLMGFHLNRNYSLIRDLHREGCIYIRKH